MINEGQNLNIETEQKKESLRQGFGQGLVSIGETNNKVVALCADLTESTKMDLFREKFPQRFFEVGVAEQNLVTVASGMAATGKIPFISSYAMFSPGRNWEQIRTTVCLNNQKVIIVGSHGGVSVGPDGSTHQALEDIALMRILPNMTVLVPADANEAYKATIEAGKIPGPVYLRLAREKTPVFTTKETPFVVGESQILFKSNIKNFEVLILACGPLVYEALQAGIELEREGIPIQVVNVSTIKPLDKKIIDYAKIAGAVVTVEEHQVAGGLSGAVSEMLAENYSVPIEFVGVRDRFGQSGKPDELLNEYGLTKKNIISASRKVLQRKITQNH